MRATAGPRQVDVLGCPPGNVVHVRHRPGPPAGLKGRPSGLANVLTPSCRAPRSPGDPAARAWDARLRPFGRYRGYVDRPECPDAVAVAVAVGDGSASRAGPAGRWH